MCTAQKTTIFPTTLQRCRGKRSYVIFCACGTCLILHSIPLRASVPSLHISGKLFVLPLPTLRYISLINRQKPRHSQQAFRLHFIPPQPLLYNRYSSFSPLRHVHPKSKRTSNLITQIKNKKIKQR